MEREETHRAVAEGETRREGGKSKVRRTENFPEKGHGYQREEDDF